MKKLTLLALALGFFMASAQETDSTKTNGGSQAQTPEQNESTAKKSQTQYRTWSVGVDVGQSSFFGDLHSFESNKQDYNSDFGTFWDFGASVTLTKWFSTLVGLEGQLAWEQLSGSQNEFAFSSTAIRPTLNVLFNITGGGGQALNKTRKSALILSGGLGISFKWGEGFQNGAKVFDLVSSGRPPVIWDETTQGASQKSLIVPVGLEWRYRFSRSWDLSVGTQAVVYIDDNVDGSNNFADIIPDTDIDGKIGIHGNMNDVSVFTSVGVNWYFGWKKENREKEIIIYDDPLSGLKQRVDKNEEGVNSLQEDNDGDGVSDYFDQDPNTPEGVAVDGAGRPTDTDGDGVPDYKDEDPFSTKGAKVDAEGRELDSDKDGVPDSRDKEPDTKEGAMVNWEGRAINNKASVYMPYVYFNRNSAELDDANEQRLARVAYILKQNPDWKVKVIGHASSTGSEKYNQNLSDRRAQAVVKTLVQNFGVNEEQLEAEGKGESEGMGTSNNVNRRVEFIITE